MAYYPGFCAKYNSSLKVLSVGTLAPAVLNPAFTTAVTTFQGESLPKITAVATLSALIGAASSVLGFICGADIHNRVNQKLTARHANMEEGGKIVRKAQAVAYAVPVAAVTVFNMAILPSTVSVTQIEKGETSQSNEDVSIPAEYQSAQNQGLTIFTLDVMS